MLYTQGSMPKHQSTSEGVYGLCGETNDIGFLPVRHAGHLDGSLWEVTPIGKEDCRC